MSLVEFALVLPILITLYLGSYQLGDAISCNRKVTIATRAAADLVSQNLNGTTSASDVNGDLYAASLVLAPYSSSAAMIRISEVDVDNNYNATILWSRGLNTSGYTPGSTANIPNAMRIGNAHFIFAEVTYSYVPAANFGITNAMKFYDSIMIMPRNSNNVTCPDC